MCSNLTHTHSKKHLLFQKSLWIMYMKIWSKSFMICLSKLTSIHLYLVKCLNEELLTCNLYMRECLSLNTTLYAISYPGITQFSLYVSTVLSNISSALSKIFFKVCPVLAIEFNAGPPYYVWVAIPTQEWIQLSIW